MLQLNNVTLVAVSGVNYHSTLFALWVSQLKIEFGAVKLVHGANFSGTGSFFVAERAIDTDLDSIDEYNRYMIYELWRHIDTDYALVVQADGYVLSSKKWRPSFLAYDYIGAPWPIREDSYIDPFGRHQRVGNGGFSLRSAKLLRVPMTRDIVFQVNEDDFYKHQNQGLLSEDGNICVHNRHIFEEEGCKFAPLAEAIQFSVETRLPERGMKRTFGFHKHLPLRLLFWDWMLRGRFLKQHPEHLA